MRTALIVTTDMGGNLPPLIGIGKELAARGWTVVVHADERVRDRAESAGLKFELASSGTRYDATEPRSTAQALRDVPVFWADRSRGNDAVAVAQRIRADVAVVDVLLVGALTQLEASGLPTAVVAHSTWEGTKAFLGGPIGVLLRLRGVDAMGSIRRSTRVLVASHAELGKSSRMPPNAVLTGPILQETPPPPTPTDRPLVLLGLSTVAFPGQREAFQRLLDAVATLPVDVRAGTGMGVDPAGLRAGANTVLERLIDHGALMPAASAVVSHGGHATTVRALAHGLPLLFMPMHPMMDQPKIARAVSASGAGLVVSKSASTERLRASLHRLLDGERYARAARRLGSELVSAGGNRRAADEIEALVGTPTRAAADHLRP